MTWCESDNILHGEDALKDSGVEGRGPGGVLADPAVCAFLSLTGLVALNVGESNVNCDLMALSADIGRDIGHDIGQLVPKQYILKNFTLYGHGGHHGHMTRIV